MLLAGALAALIVLGFVAWAVQLETVAVRPPPPGTIDVTSATFGGNCGAEANNIVQFVKSACSGKKQCDFVFDWNLLGNPARSCNKDFHVQWTCSPGGKISQQYLPSDPPQGTVVPLACP